jgi:hypothetical protein
MLTASSKGLLPTGRPAQYLAAAQDCGAKSLAALIPFRMISRGNILMSAFKCKRVG